MRYGFILLLAILGFCDRDETVAAYGAADQIWRLHSIDGNRYPAEATLTFPQEGILAGSAPCNTFNGTLDAPYPWFEVTNLAATRAACPELEAEGTYFAALMAMTQSEVSGTVLILRNDDGHEMVFKSAE